MYDVSVIVPIYNMGWCLKEHLDALLKIHHDNYEIILVDDGSTDDSLEICYAYQSQRVKVLHKTNGGISSARNAGLDVATGKYIYFYDPDDAVEPEIFQDLDFEKADLIVFGYGAEYYMDGVFERKVDYTSEPRLYTKNELEQYLALTTKLQFPIWNKIFRRDLIEEHNIRFPAINCWEDACFVMIYLRYVRGVRITAESYYHYRIEQKRQSLSKQKYVPNRQDQYLALHQANLETLRSLGVENAALYTGNDVRLLYNAASDFFYNTTPKSVSREQYATYYTKLLENASILSALQNDQVIQSLSIYEAKFFRVAVQFYLRRHSIGSLRFCYYVFGILFSIRKGRK